MANTDLPITDTIKKNPKILFQLRQALGILYDENGKLAPGNETEAESLLEQIHSPEVGIPENYTIKEIGIVIEKWYETLTQALEFEEPTMTGAPEYSVSSTTPTPDELAQGMKEAQAHQEKIEKTQAEAKSAVEAAIKRQQEIYEEDIQKAKGVETALKDKKIYYKVEESAQEESQEVKNLRGQAVADPKIFIKDAAAQIKNSPNLTNLSADEAKLVSEQTAVTTYEILVGDSPIINTAVMNKIVSSPEILNRLAPNTETQRILKDATFILIDQNTFQFELSNQLINLAKIDGLTRMEDVKIKFSDTPKEGYREFSLNQQIISPYLRNLEDSNLLVGNLKDFGEDQIKSRVLSTVGTKLENYVTKLPVNGLLTQTYNSEIVQLGLSSLGIVEAAPWVAVPGSWAGRVIVSSGFGNVAGFIQAKTGINLGVKLAAKAVGTKVAGAVTGEVVAGVVGAVGGEAAGAAVGVAAGSVIPIIGNAIGLVVGAVVGWVSSKIPWEKVKGWSAAILGGAAGLIALPFVGIGGALGIGVGTAGISAAFGAGLGGLTLGGVGSGIVGFLGALGGATLGAIGIPILATLIGFPVVVALILFIINSGAYVTPSNSYSNLGPRDCSIGTKIVDRAKAINNNLQLGFNNYYNKSPDYPELWNAALFARNPNPAFQNVAIGMEDMFWCNYMPIKSYLAINEDIPFSLTAIMNYFQGQGRWISGDVATTDNICPGDAIFFRSPANALLLAHVAVVYSVSADEIITVQSNSKWKTMTYFTDASGRFPVYGSGNDTIKIVGFGAP
jgi:hypothetical protein